MKMDSPLPPKGKQARPQKQKYKNIDDAIRRWSYPVDRSRWAIAAGYVALFSVLILPAPLALFLGIIAVIDIRRNMSKDIKVYGMGRALFAIVLGGIITALLLFYLIATLIRGITSHST
jgi:hypothetical protein